MGGAWWYGVVVVVLIGIASSCGFTDDQIVQLFQEYIQINSTTDNDQTPVVEYWRELAAAEENVSFKVLEFTPGYPVILMRWPGEDCSLRSVMLNSHMDVVPAFEEDGWTHPPFAAHIADGMVYGRGTQDMKSVTLQYFMALKRLCEKNVKLLRDVYMTIVPDEEHGSPDGMNPLLLSEEFQEMNIGVELDEGGAYPAEFIPLLVQDKVVWQFQIICTGTATHGSTFVATNNTATGQCRNMMNILFEFRDQEFTKSLTVPVDKYTSINLNKMEAGTANNIVPGRVVLTYDVRLATDLDEFVFEKQLNEWVKEAGPNVTLKFLEKDRQSPATLLTSANPHWEAVKEAVAAANRTVVTVVAPGSTDARFVRKAGYPAFGISPMPNTPGLLHQVDERLGVQTLLDGIEVYEKLIEKLANLPAAAVSDDPSDYVAATTPPVAGIP